MDNVNTTALITLLVHYGTKLLGALALWFIGSAVINFTVARLERASTHSKLDQTARSYLLAALRITAKVALVIGMLGFFGVETTSFAAILAAAGVAIGMAWSGLLANFAAGVFLAMLRPFAVGDMISAAGVTGDVIELGLFTTTLHTPDGVRVYVGNNKLFSDNIVNYSANANRRVELTAQLSSGADVAAVIASLKQALARIPNVATTPAPEVTILEFNLVGPVLAVRPHTNNRHYWQVYFDTNETIRATLANFPAPRAQFIIPVEAGANGAHLGRESTAARPH